MSNSTQFNSLLTIHRASFVILIELRRADANVLSATPRMHIGEFATKAGTFSFGKGMGTCRTGQLRGNQQKIDGNAVVSDVT